VNTFKVTADEESSAGARPLLTIDPEVEQQQIARLRAVRATRSADTWRAGLDAVTAAARDGVNLVPPIVAAVEARATLGEIADAMRAVFGEYHETATV
jgi:methylmalonyl-CoA mutase N-terminal domain/subunit